MALRGWRATPRRRLRQYAYTPACRFKFGALCALCLFTNFYFTRDTVPRDSASGALVEIVPGLKGTAGNTTEPLGAVLDVGNPTLLSHEMQKLWFISRNETFEIPTDIEWIMKYAGCRTKQGHTVDYMRGTDEIVTRGKQGTCGGTLDVLRWLMERVNESKGCLMMTYGGLIHAHREKSFVNKKTGKFLDDDIDTFVALDTFAYIGSLEEELFDRFGWSIRIHQLNGKFAVLGQVFASCGHKITLGQSKATSSLPTIELYPIVTFKTSEPMIEAFPNTKFANVERKEQSIVRDIWQGSLFHESMIFPRSNMTLVSEWKGSKQPLNLQIPGQSLKLLDCLYGNWKVPSGKRAGTRNCL